jgi:hypothetical protein
MFVNVAKLIQSISMIAAKTVVYVSRALMLIVSVAVSVLCGLGRMARSAVSAQSVP